MRSTRLAVLLMVMCVGAWSLSALAEQGQTDKDATHVKPTSPTQGTSGQHQPGMGGTAQRTLAPALMESPNEQQIQGKILGESKDVDVEGDKEHRIVRVQTKDGKVVMVDLGRTDRLPDGLEVREGQWVLVTGVPGRVGNDQVLVAHNLANVFSFRPGASATGNGAALEDKDKSLREKISDDVREGTGGSVGEKDNDTRAQYKDYPGHVGESGPGAGQKDADQSKGTDKY